MATVLTSDTTLKSFLLTVFFPGKQFNKSDRERQRYITAHNRLRIQLGRDPLLTDMTPDGFESFRLWMAPRWSVGSFETSGAAWRRIVDHLQGMGFAIDGPPDNRVQPIGSRERLGMGVPVEPLSPGEKPQTLRQLFQFLFVPLRMRGRSKTTIARYRGVLDAFHRHLGRDPLLSDLRDETVSAFLYSIIENGRSPSHANSNRNNLLCLWRFAARKRVVEEFPEVPPLLEPVRIPRARPRDELDRLWQALDILPGKVGQVPSRLWWKALHFVAFFAGERIGAILQIEWRDIDLSSGWLICRAETRKFGASDKATRLPAEAIDSLRAIASPSRKLVFEMPFSTATLYDRYERILKRAGLSADRKSKFHILRRSAASHLKAAGGDPQALLGHASLKTTAGYLDPRICPPPQPADLLFVPGGAA